MRYDRARLSSRRELMPSLANSARVSNPVREYVADGLTDADHTLEVRVTGSRTLPQWASPSS
jgi:hypothetical protein